jgi:hypothetical protein
VRARAVLGYSSARVVSRFAHEFGAGRHRQVCPPGRFAPGHRGAVVDALAEFGVEHLDMPVTPERVWRAIHT